MEQTKRIAQSTFTTQDLCYIAAFTALTAILAQISIPLPGGVPLTLQTFAVPLAGVVLGARRGTVSVLLYLLLGAVGLPVFAGMTGGLGRIVGLTGGFLFSFPLMAWTAGLWADRGLRSPRYWFGLVAGAVCNYAVGTAWFMLAGRAGLGAALAACVIPFLPTAVLKIIMTGLVGTMLRESLRRGGVL